MDLWYQEEGFNGQNFLLSKDIYVKEHARSFSEIRTPLLLLAINKTVLYKDNEVNFDYPDSGDYKKVDMKDLRTDEY